MVFYKPCGPGTAVGGDALSGGDSAERVLEVLLGFSEVSEECE